MGAPYYDPETSFRPGSPGCKHQRQISPDGKNIIPDSYYPWYLGKYAYDYLHQSDYLKNQPLCLEEQDKELIGCLNKIISDIPKKTLKVYNYDYTVGESLRDICSFAQEEEGYNSPCFLALFLDSLYINANHESLFCANTYAIITLITLNSLPLALQEQDIDLICYITHMAGLSVAEFQRDSPHCKKLQAMSKKGISSRQNKNRAAKAFYIALFKKNYGTGGYKNKTLASQTMSEIEFEGTTFKFSTLQRWLNGVS